MSAQPYYHYVLADKYSEIGQINLLIFYHHMQTVLSRSGARKGQEDVSSGPPGEAGHQDGSPLRLHHGPRPAPDPGLVRCQQVTRLVIMFS